MSDEPQAVEVEDVNSVDAPTELLRRLASRGNDDKLARIQAMLAQLLDADEAKEKPHRLAATIVALRNKNVRAPR